MSLVLRDGKEPEVAVCSLPIALDSVEGNKAGFPGFQMLCLWEAPVLQMHLLSEHESLGQMTSEVQRG